MGKAVSDASKTEVIAANLLDSCNVVWRDVEVTQASWDSEEHHPYSMSEDDKDPHGIFGSLSAQTALRKRHQRVSERISLSLWSRMQQTIVDSSKPWNRTYG
eukprot:408675-Amphidinium_carterae.1